MTKTYQLSEQEIKTAVAYWLHATGVTTAKVTDLSVSLSASQPDRPSDTVHYSAHVTELPPSKE